MKLLLTGGVLRPNGFELGEGKYYGGARLLRLDTHTGETETLLEVNQGTENFPDEDPNLEFTVGDVEPGRLWLSMDTEIRRYDYPSLELRETFSHPCFHNIHSVAVRGQDLYVTSTGLDHVAILDKRTGGLKSLINTEGKPTWHRFSESTDYRKIHSTRPHDCHPNYVFWVDDQPWVTRCTQEDAVCLSDPSISIDISGRRKPISVHDGIVHQGEVYFTTVDGAVVAVDVGRRTVVRTIELHSLKGFGGVRGWCRGLYFHDGLCYVAFSRLRRTRRLEKIAWVKKLMLKGGFIESPSVLAVDLDALKIVGDFRIPDGAIDAIYSVLPEPEAA